MLNIADHETPAGAAAVITACRQALESGFRYADVEALLARAKPWLDRAETSELALLIGAVLTRCGEWDRASSLLAEQARRFENDTDVTYEAALVSIDAGQHARARELFLRLGARLDSLSLRHLRGLWRGCCMVGLFDVALAAITAARAQDAAFASPHLVERIETARSVQKSLDHPPIRLVSLGDNCLPWMVGNRWGLRADPSAAEELSVFNLAQCSPESVSNLLASRARAILDPAELAWFATDIGTPLPYHAPTGFQFNHEQGERWCEHDFARLRAKYGKAVEGLEASFAGAPRIFLHYREKAGDIGRLIDAVEQVNANDRYRLLIIDANTDSAEPAPHRKATFCRIPLPFPDYVWFKPDHYESAAGIEFERKIAVAVLSEMATLRA